MCLNVHRNLMHTKCFSFFGGAVCYVLTGILCLCAFTSVPLCSLGVRLACRWPVSHHVCLQDCRQTTSFPLSDPKPYQECDPSVFKVKSARQSGTQYSIQYLTSTLAPPGLMGEGLLNRWKKAGRKGGRDGRVLVCGCGFFFIWGGV